jgi:predicted metal-dependent peptidase
MKMSEQSEFQKQITSAILQLRLREPFFAALALFAAIKETPTTPTAATDGRAIYINPTFWKGLTPAQRLGVLAHEILHVALLHVHRRGTRDARLWNIAVDIVVNGIILSSQGMELPPGHVRDTRLESRSAEEIYHRLLEQRSAYASLSFPQDLLEAAGDPPGAREQEQLQRYWWKAVHHARSTSHGAFPLGLQRELAQLDPERLDWRSYLWRFLTQTPVDFRGFDRRFIGQKLYLDAHEGEQLSVYIAVDTSGSISQEELRLFLSEVHGILRAYPHVVAHLYYTDTQCYGPYELRRAGEELPEPKGGGGTDFRPFFERVAAETEPARQVACVYLTDGFGTFPTDAPLFPVLWALTADGLDAAEIPFGEVVRLTPAEESLLEEGTPDAGQAAGEDQR